MKKIILFLIFILSTGTLCFGQCNGLLLDDFEGVVSGGSEGTVDFGAGGGSTLEVTAETKIKYSGSQSLKLAYEAVYGGYMWAARGFDLDAQNAGWLVSPEQIDWSMYKAIAFYIYGAGSNGNIVIDIKDNGNELWRFIFKDDTQGWKRVVCPFAEFFARDDWQPASADKNAILDFPLKSFQFEPQPEAKGVLYFDDMELIKNE